MVLLTVAAVLLVAGPVRGWLARPTAAPVTEKSAAADAPRQVASQAPAQARPPATSAPDEPSRPELHDPRRTASDDARTDAGRVPEPRADTKVPRRPSQAEVDRALRAVHVRMFSTAWCGVCSKARTFLRANDLSYVEQDIDRDERARAELRRRSGRSAVPTLEIDGQLLKPGFNERAIVSALRASVESRLGTSGIRVRQR